MTLVKNARAVFLEPADQVRQTQSILLKNARAVFSELVYKTAWTQAPVPPGRKHRYRLALPSSLSRHRIDISNKCKSGVFRTRQLFFYMQSILLINARAVFSEPADLQLRFIYYRCWCIGMFAV